MFNRIYDKDKTFDYFLYQIWKSFNGCSEENKTLFMMKNGDYKKRNRNQMSNDFYKLDDSWAEKDIYKILEEIINKNINSEYIKILKKILEIKKN